MGIYLNQRNYFTAGASGFFTNVNRVFPGTAATEGGSGPQLLAYNIWNYVWGNTSQVDVGIDLRTFILQRILRLDLMFHRHPLLWRRDFPLVLLRLASSLRRASIKAPPTRYSEDRPWRARLHRNNIHRLQNPFAHRRDGPGKGLEQHPDRSGSRLRQPRHG